jgi:diguanylate cyclase (GGDEF)-like protein
VYLRKNKVLILLMGFLLISVIGIVDYLTGYELAFSVFYVLPISLVTWLTSRRIGLLVSLASAAVWLIADLGTGHPYSHALVLVWNTLIRFAFFVIITLLISSLRSALQRESELARIDYLTGAVNRRFFYELLQMEIDRFERYKHPFTLAYIDLDNFKALNDRFGHAMGDRVLRTVATSIRNHSRKTDIFARIGGDEFALLLPETNQGAALTILPEIQDHLSSDMRKNNWPITFSIGVLTCITSSHSAQALMKRADELMYLVKREQKNSTRYSILEADYDQTQE